MTPDLIGAAAPPPGALALWYRRPAERWLQALPLGNGALGAMVFGGLSTERIQLNEESLWSGGPWDTNNPEALAHLPEVRQLLFEGRFAEATDLTHQHLLGKPERIRLYETVCQARRGLALRRWVLTLSLGFAFHPNRKPLTWVR